jgi:glycosyltransferase involved in cell wall biosynthesis
MSCGVPVVGFNVGGIPDMVRQGDTGMLVPPQDASALRIALAELLQNSAKRTEMAENCRRIATEEYSLEVQAQRYVDLYETIRGEQIGQT